MPLFSSPAELRQAGPARHCIRLGGPLAVPMAPHPRADAAIERAGLAAQDPKTATPYSVEHELTHSRSGIA
jgi:hypothetical protein